MLRQALVFTTNIFYGNCCATLDRHTEQLRSLLRENFEIVRA